MESTISTLVEDGKIEQWVAWHEFGHMYSSQLAKAIGLEYNCITEVLFKIQAKDDYQAKVISSPIHNWQDAVEGSIIRVGTIISDVDRSLFFPILLGYASGFVFDDLFSHKGDVINMIWGKHNQDAVNIRTLRNLTNLNADNLDNIIRRYKALIQINHQSIDHLLATLLSTKVNLNGGVVKVIGEELEKMLLKFHDSFDIGFLDKVKQFYCELPPFEFR